jgi:endogenous inhibitor of DNA gyrase (YacG/DUF329 family)
VGDSIHFDVNSEINGSLRLALVRTEREGGRSRRAASTEPVGLPEVGFSVLPFGPVGTARCPICKKQLSKRTKNFPFCSERCKLIDAGNWFEGNYRVETKHDDFSWGEN